uniref:Uncharacterized protein n=1 Tax=Rhodnius prolixus TaxID=13249 RepID=T1HYK6_RHOPR
MLNPKKISQQRVIESLKNNQAIQKEYYDRGSKPLKTFRKGERIRMFRDKNWLKGKVNAEGPSPRSYKVLLEDGGKLTRNRRFLKPLRTPQEEDDTDDEESEEDEEDDTDDEETDIETFYKNVQTAIPVEMKDPEKKKKEEEEGDSNSESRFNVTSPEIFNPPSHTRSGRPVVKPTAFFQWFKESHNFRKSCTFIELQDNMDVSGF